MHTKPRRPSSPNLSSESFRTAVSRRRRGAGPVLWLGAALALVCACKGGAPPQASGQGIAVSGRERIAWNQVSPDGQVLQYSYVAYVDDVRQPLADVSCTPSAGDTQAECVAPLPHISSGVHRLEVASVQTVLGVAFESPRSGPLVLIVSASTAASAAAAAESAPLPLPKRGDPERPVHEENRFVVETIATGLTLPSGVAALPDRRLLVAEASGSVRLWQDGEIGEEPAAILRGLAQNGDVGLIDLTIHPHFAQNGLVFVAYTAEARDGRLANRVVRLRLVRNTLADPVALLEEPVDEIPRRTPRVRFGADGKLYVAFPAGESPTEADDPARYVGKILRLNEDGTTPADNPGFSPIVSAPHRAPGGFAWDPERRQLWLADRDWGNQDALYAGVSARAAAYPFDSAVDPAAAAFYTRSEIAGFTGNLFIAALDGQHIRRVQFDPSGGVAATERLLDGQFGRIGDVTVGPDGALYFSTANSVGGASGGSDRLLRLKAR
jgi:glucose/arabinose dehydrogenase